MRSWLQLIEYAEEQTEQAARALTEIQQKISAVESQHEQMKGYREEYARRATVPGTTARIHQINTIRRFGDQVQITVSDLESRLTGLREHYLKKKQAWQKCYQREKALKALQSIEERKAAIAQDRIDRRNEDDFVLQARRRRDAG